jgi:hypothetical protein
MEITLTDACHVFALAIRQNAKARQILMISIYDQISTLKI